MESVGPLHQPSNASVPGTHLCAVRYMTGCGKARPNSGCGPVGQELADHGNVVDDSRRGCFADDRRLGSRA